MSDKRKKEVNISEMRSELDDENQKVLDRFIKEVNKRDSELKNDLVDRVLNEVLAIDGVVRMEGLFPTAKSRIRYRNSIKKSLNEMYGYDLPIKSEDDDQLIKELKEALEEDEDNEE